MRAEHKKTAFVIGEPLKLLGSDIGFFHSLSMDSIARRNAVAVAVV